MTHRLLASVALAFALGLAAPVAMAQAVPKILKKVPPEFPSAATKRGIEKAVVKVKLTVDGAGVPTEVSVTDVQPPNAKIINPSVIEALEAWRFEGAGKAHTFEIQLVLVADT